MAMESDQHQLSAIIPAPQDNREEEKDARGFDHTGCEELATPLPLSVTSRVLYMLGDLTSGPAYRFTQWLELVRKRTIRSRSSSFLPRPDASMPFSAGDTNPDSKSPTQFEQITDVSLWKRLGKATMLDIESSSFSWGTLSSLHHTEHSASTDQSEDETNKALEVTVNSGGVVFFALFDESGNDFSNLKEGAAVIKISSSRIATQSERLGYELAKWLGVRVPQARVVHNCSSEWLQIKEAAEKARCAASSIGDEVGEMTCSELLEALELSRCLFLMNYVHGCALLENSNAFGSQEAAEEIASALGRILMLDLIIRNEDRLPCRELGWRGNSANLLLADKKSSTDMEALEEAHDSSTGGYGPRAIGTSRKDRRTTSVASRLDAHSTGYGSHGSDHPNIVQPPISSKRNVKDRLPIEAICNHFHIVAIDSGVPRRPPAGKRANDHENYPKLVELLLNSSAYSSNLLHEITAGKLGTASEYNATDVQQVEKMDPIVHAFRSGFRAALRDMQGFHIFLLTLHQKLDSLLRIFLSIIDHASAGELDKEELMVPESPQFTLYNLCPPNKEHAESSLDSNETESQRASTRQSFAVCREASDSTSPSSRDSWHGKFCKGSGDAVRSLRLTAKLRDIHKYAKVDAELSKELEQWNEMLRNDAVKMCQENNFQSGFFEGSDTNCVVDAYELKVRLEHILERISIISEAANTERPSLVTGGLFIGGTLAARSVYTLQHLGITHILCLCCNEIGQSDSQYPRLFEYRNFSITDEEDTNISSIFGEACDFIDHVEETGGKVLVHCFEGRSRSATMVLAYLMLRKQMTLLEAWNSLKKVHRRAQPNDGFARMLLDLDKKVYGKVSMEWQQRRPSMKVCPICGRNAGLSTSSLKLHLQKSHKKKLSSGSVDSAMTLEIHKAAMSAMKMMMSRGGSVSPTPTPTPTQTQTD
ncbi:Very-long-chain (3R)-3-hydroxyacyl-CoA dehydratase [Dionaea muscipula]